MPLIEDKDQAVQFDRLIDYSTEVEPAEDETTFRERVRAAFALDNTIGSLIAQEAGLPDGVKATEYDVWGDLTDDERLDDRFIDNVTYVDNRAELDAVRRQRDKEARNREILQGGGILESIAVGMVDPINVLLPGSVAFKTYKTGGRILDGALSTGAAGLLSSGVTETALQATQINRTLEESALNMSAATFLSGVLGATPGTINRLFTKPQLEEIEMTMDPEAAIRDGGNPAMADRSIGAAEVDNDAEVRGKLAKKMTKLLAFDPLSRTITSDAAATRKAVNALAENPIEMDRPIGTSVESLIKAHDGKYMEAAMDAKSFFKEYKKSGGTLNNRQFREEVGRAMRNGSDNPYIQQTADAFRTKLYDPLKKDAIDLGLLPEDVDVTTAEGYLNRIWNKEKIAENSNEFIDITKRWLDDQAEIKVSKKAEIEKVDAKIGKIEKAEISAVKRKATAQKQLEAAQKKLDEVQRQQKVQDTTQLRSRAKTLQKQVDANSKKVADFDRQLKDFEAQKLQSTKDIEAMIKDFPSKIANEVRSMIKAREGVEAKSMTRTLKRAVERIKRTAYEDIEPVDNEMLAREIMGRIMGTPDGRLPYDYKVGENSAKGAPSALAGTFKKRSFLIPDSLVEQFLENDIELLSARYLRSMAPDIELVRRFGSGALNEDIKMTSLVKDIEQEYIEKMSKAKTGEERRKLNKLKDRDIADIAGMRDRMRGQYKVADHENLFVRAMRVARDFNYMRLLGGVVAASIPDTGRIVGAEGITNTFRYGLKPLVTNLRAFRVAGNEAKRYGIASDALMGSRAEIIADVADYSRGGTAFERGVRTAATKFSSINLMNQWTSAIKQLHAVTVQTRVANELLQGKYDKRLGQLGISEGDAKNIAAQLKKYGKKMDGVWVWNTKDWDNQDLAMMWAAGLRKESDRVIIVPGQDKPLFMSTEMGKTFFQFKSFMFSATQRVLISSLQAQDKHYIQGMLGLVGLGMLSYAFKEWDAGRELSDDPRTWVMEGIDRSGALGILMEANNTLEKISSNHFGLRPLVGINVPASRYAARSVLDSMVGPTFGLADTVIRAANAVTSENEWTDADTRAFRRLLPGQNLSFLRQGLDRIEEELGQ